MKKLLLMVALFTGAAAAATPCGAYADFSTVAGASSNLYSAMNGKFNIQCGTTAPTSLAGTSGVDGYINTSNGNFYICTATGTPCGNWFWVNSGATGPGYTATSTTSLSVSAASKTLTTQTGLAYSVGGCLTLVSASTPAAYMTGPITAYNSSTGSLTFTATSAAANVCGGLGTGGPLTDWNLSVGGLVGATGASGSGTGTINSGTTGQVAEYTGSGTTVGGIGPGTTSQVLHGNASGSGSFGSVVNADIANSTIDLTAKVTGALPQANISAVSVPTPGATCTFANNSTICVCTTTCTITTPVPAAGKQFCAVNDDNVSTVITLSAIGSSAMYESTARTAYGTAGTGTLVSGGAVKDFVCLMGRDSTHYFTLSSSGTWTAN